MLKTSKDINVWLSDDPLDRMWYLLRKTIEEANDQYGIKLEGRIQEDLGWLYIITLNDKEHRLGFAISEETLINSNLGPNDLMKTDIKQVIQQFAKHREEKLEESGDMLFCGGMERDEVRAQLGLPKINKNVKHYYCGLSMLCGVPSESSAGHLATINYKDVTCLKCLAHIILITKSVYEDVNSLKEFLKIIGA